IDCLSNHSKCHASCCRILAFKFKGLDQRQIDSMKQSKQLSFQLPLLSDDLVNYYKLHNCKVERNPNRTWTLTVPSQRTRIMKSDNNSFWVQTSTPCSALNGDLYGL